MNLKKNKLSENAAGVLSSFVLQDIRIYKEPAASSFGGIDVKT